MSIRNDQPLAPPPSPGWRTAHATQRAETWVQTTLVVVVTGLLLYVMAVPKARRSMAELGAQRETVELRLTLGELRAMIAGFRADHGCYPGWPPNARRDRGEIRASEEWFELQLTLSTNSSAEIAVEPLPSHPFGPYAREGLPRNPVNGLSSIQVLGPRQGWPPEPDGTSGWTYSARTGEIRANCAGKPFAGRVRFWDL